MFGIFGPSQEIQRLDRALRAAGLHPRAVPLAVKLTTVKQLKEANFGRAPDPSALAAAAELLAYCALGRDEFAEVNGARQTGEIEARLTDALETGYGLDARLVILALHAGLVHQGVVERYQLAME